MNSLRQRLVAAVLARFRSITVAGGYQTDVGNRVFLWRTTALGSTDLPGIVLRDRGGESTLVGRVSHEHRIYFEADLYMAGDGDIRALLADVQKAIAWMSPDKTQGGIRWLVDGDPLAVDTQPLDDQIDALQEERKLNAARLRFVVVQRTKPFDPYTLASPT